MGLTVYTGAMNADQQGDITLDPKTHGGAAGTLDGVSVSVNNELATATVSDDKLTVNVKATGTTGDVVVTVTADKDLAPDHEDNEVGEFHITIAPAATETVAFAFGNVRPNDQP